MCPAKKFMRKFFLLALVFFILVPVLMVKPARTAAQAGDAWQLISEVNGLRSAYGLPPYEVNNSLMSAAQIHSNYQAEIGTWTHTGPGGSRPYDRAVAAGFGGGAQVFVSENVAMGIDLSTRKIVHEMWQDAIHLETMVSPRYTHIGAGVGRAGDYVYYTILVGYIAGAAGSSDSAQDDPAPTEVGGTPIPTRIPVEPISVASPGEDGSIFHVVQWGQFLENIAAAYEIELADLLALNGINNETVIYPGDKLLIKAGQTPVSPLETGGSPEASEIEEVTDTPQATSTPERATNTPTQESPQELAMAVSTAVGSSPAETPSTTEHPPIEGNSGPDYLLLAVFGLALAGTAMILVGNALKQQA
jgi:LysM repeat protein